MPHGSLLDWAIRLGRLLTGRQVLRWYRRIRWRRDPGWVARTRRQPPAPDIILVGRGDRNLSLALWQVQGPVDMYSLDLTGQLAATTIQDFPAAGFKDSSGHQPAWDELRFGRYWAILYAWSGNRRIAICKVPFRIYDSESKFWPWYEGKFVRAWEIWFGGTLTVDGG